MIMENLFSTLPILLGIAFFGFSLSRIFKRNDIADVMWGLGFLILGIFSLESFQNLNFKTIFVLSLTGLWSLRLSLYLGLRSSKKNEDIRYENMKKDWGKREPLNAFLRVFLMQSLIMGLVAIPVSYTHLTPPTICSV